jgi:hypothetical protein
MVRIVLFIPVVIAFYLLRSAVLGKFAVIQLGLSATIAFRDQIHACTMPHRSDEVLTNVPVADSDPARNDLLMALHLRFHRRGKVRHRLATDILPPLKSERTRKSPLPQRVL